MKFGKGKNLLIKDNISWDVNPTSADVNALEAFMHVAVAKEKRIVWSGIEAFYHYMDANWASMHNQKLEAKSSHVHDHKDILEVSSS